MIEVQRERCRGCGACVEVCPFTVLALDGTGKAVNTGKACIRCLHCAAICPEGAITCGERAPVLERSVHAPDARVREALEEMIYQRRSYRRFLPKEIDGEVIRHALTAAMHAPSAKNQHPTKWLVVRGDALREALMQAILDYCVRESVSPEVVSECAAGNNPVMGTNAALIVGYCHEAALNPAQDTAIALTTAELILQSQGIGTCWAGYFTRFANAIPEVRELLKLPRRHNVYGALMAGYPAQKPYEKIPARLKGASIRWLT